LSESEIRVGGEFRRVGAHPPPPDAGIVPGARSPDQAVRQTKERRSRFKADLSPTSGWHAQPSCSWAGPPVGLACGVRSRTAEHKARAPRKSTGRSSSH